MMVSYVRSTRRRLLAFRTLTVLRHRSTIVVGGFRHSYCVSNISDIILFFVQGESHQTDLSLNSRYIGSFFLEPRSLVCFKNTLYTDYLHGIEEVSIDDISEKKILNRKFTKLSEELFVDLTRKTRVSVTIRNFPKTLKVALKLGRR